MRNAKFETRLAVDKPGQGGVGSAGCASIEERALGEETSRWRR
jgi:hypothetical protein